MFVVLRFVIEMVDYLSIVKGYGYSIVVMMNVIRSVGDDSNNKLA